MKRLLAFCALLALGAAATVSAESWLVIAQQRPLPAGLAEAVVAAGGTVTQTIPEIGVLAAWSEDSSFLTKASVIKGVQSVVPNLQWNLLEAATPADAPPPPPTGWPLVFDWNYPKIPAAVNYSGFQWNLDAIDAPEAWAAGARGASVRVAVLDTGVFRFHPDVTPNLNTELSTSFVNVPGWSELYWNDYMPFAYWDGIWLLSGHGTAMASLIAAPDDGVGITGVAPQAEIVAVKIMSAIFGFSDTSWLAGGIVYAANIDADVINVSIGTVINRHGLWYDSGTPDNPADDVWLSAEYLAHNIRLVMQRAVNYAHQRGCTIVAATLNNFINGDEDRDGIILPAQSPHVLGIGATGPWGWGFDPTVNLDTPGFYQNYGQSLITFAAPGGNANYDIFLASGAMMTDVGGTPVPTWRLDGVMVAMAGWWSYLYGTSTAAPHAAGVAALIIGQNGGQMAPAAVASRMAQGADDLGKAGRDDYYGLGRLNAYKAVTAKK